jgi:hypothetical protein
MYPLNFAQDRADFMGSGPQIGHTELIQKNPKKNTRPSRGVIKCDLFARKNSDVCIRIEFFGSYSSNNRSSRS